jgi:hypothetical protein
MTLSDIGGFLQDNSGVISGVIIVVLSLVEISPIKINPWSWLGSVFNKSIIDRMDKQDEQIKELREEVAETRKEVNENSATSARYRILRFDDELLHDMKHTKEHFDQILVDIDIYEKFCIRNPDFRNNLATMAISHVKNVYQKCITDNSFL